MYIVNNIENSSVDKENLKNFGLTCFTNLMTAYIICQYFNCMHSSDFTSNISSLRQIGKTIYMRTSIYF